MTECAQCAELRGALHQSMLLAGAPLSELELKFALLPDSRRLAICGNLTLVLATDQHLICILPATHPGEHAVRIPVSEMVLLRTVTVVAEQLVGALHTGDRAAAALASDLLSRLLTPGIGTDALLSRRVRNDD